MYSFPSQTPDGSLRLEWYLEDGTPAATSDSVPSPVEGRPLWEHRDPEGTLVGKTLEVETGFGHYTPEGDLIEETEKLQDFWILCGLAKRKATATAGDKNTPPGSASNPGSGADSAPSSTPAVPAPASEEPDPFRRPRVAAGVGGLSVLASLGVLLLPHPPAMPRPRPMTTPAAEVSPRSGAPVAASSAPSPAPIPQEKPMPAPKPASPLFSRTPAPAGEPLVESPPSTPPPTHPRPAQSIPLTLLPPTPAPQPPPAAAEPGSAEDTRAFITQLREFENAQDLPAILGCYGDLVDFFDHGTVDREFIRQDKLAYFTRWPVAKHVITGDISVTRLSDNRFVSFTTTFVLKNGTRHIEGTARTEMHLVWRNGSFAVVRERAEVLEKHDLTPPAQALSSSGPTSAAAIDFARRLRDLENSQQLDAIMANYADKVMYFKEGIITRDKVRRDKADYFSHWPRARQTITGNVQVVPLDPASCQVAYMSEFVTENREGTKHVRGRCHCQLTLRWSGDSYKVVQETGQVLDRQEIPGPAR